MFIYIMNNIKYFLLYIILNFIFIYPNYCLADQNTLSYNNNILNIIIMIFILFFIIYFFIIRPQSKKNKEYINLIKNLKIGDEVITTGGIIGKIKKLNNKFVIIQLSKHVEIIIKKRAILASLPHNTLKYIF